MTAQDASAVRPAPPSLRRRGIRAFSSYEGAISVALLLVIAVVSLLAVTLILQQSAPGWAQGQESSHLGDTDPVWSPTGKLIAFVSTRDLKPEIYTMDADGRTPRRLTTSPSGMESSAPAWSPDGRCIVFVTGSRGGSQIFVMNANGSEQRLLTSGGLNRTPAWSPDGRRIAFVSNRTGNDRVYVIAAEAGEPVILTVGWPRLLGFSWSPDGKRLVFAVEKSEAIPAPFPLPYTFRDESVINVVDVTGRNQTTIVMDTAWSSGPAWSPDGKRIAFLFSGTIYAMNPDGSGRVQLTSEGAPSGPVWSPDWRRIVYASKRGELWQLYAVNPDGTADTQLTEGR